jgi:hypothetical protein
LTVGTEQEGAPSLPRKAGSPHKQNPFGSLEKTCALTKKASKGAFRFEPQCRRRSGRQWNSYTHDLAIKSIWELLQYGLCSEAQLESVAQLRA